MYAKLINDILQIAPKKVECDNTIIYNPPGDIYEALGFYLVEYTDMPDDAPEGYHYEYGWEQGENSIIQTWHLEEDDPNISDDEALAIIMGDYEE